MWIKKKDIAQGWSRTSPISEPSLWSSTLHLHFVSYLGPFRWSETRWVTGYCEGISLLSRRDWDTFAPVIKGNRQTANGNISYLWEPLSKKTDSLSSVPEGFLDDLKNHMSKKSHLSSCQSECWWNLSPWSDWWRWWWLVVFSQDWPLAGWPWVPPALTLMTILQCPLLTSTCNTTLSTMQCETS